jgi:hypothetical protein
MAHEHSNIFTKKCGSQGKSVSERPGGLRLPERPLLLLPAEGAKGRKSYPQITQISQIGWTVHTAPILCGTCR